MFEERRTNLKPWTPFAAFLLLNTINEIAFMLKLPFLCIFFVLYSFLYIKRILRLRFEFNHDTFKFVKFIDVFDLKWNYPSFALTYICGVGTVFLLLPLIFIIRHICVRLPFPHILFVYIVHYYSPYSTFRFMCTSTMNLIFSNYPYILIFKIVRLAGNLWMQETVYRSE